MTRTLVVALLLCSLQACQRQGGGEAWLGPITVVDVPAAAGSRFPNLAGGSDLPVVLSWLQPDAEAGFSLRYSEWSTRDLGSTRGWDPSRKVASGTDWLVNWADFPSVVPVSSHVWAAHWLKQKPDDVYAYDVSLAVSSDAGRRWSGPMSPHDDGTLTEHGFVSLLSDGSDRTRAIWLDGRRTPGEHDHASTAATPGGAMSLRTAILDASGRRLGPDVELDARVCDCCQTDAVLSGDAALVVYRDRSDDETRDVRALRIEADGATTSVVVHRDGWHVAACPVNGPAVAAHGERVAVAWFTAPDRPRIRVAFSRDGGRSFTKPVEVASGPIAGRVDVVLMPDGRAIVSWLAEGASGARLEAQPFTESGTAGPAITVALGKLSRASGFPQMLRAGPDLVFAWTEMADPTQVRTAFARLL